MKYNTREKITIIAILIAIIEADGIIDPRETDFLNDVIIDFDLSESELEQTMEMDFNLVINEFKQFNNDKKRKAMELFIGMAECDGYADSREIMIIDSIF
ncbi:MAG: hypothetical protein NC406_02235 [Bacteroides sp.]|nr:hypothetical protein [Bacteroides sp.]MCM1094856.1 hypothetical protein [Terasakiella sp.]